MRKWILEKMPMVFAYVVVATMFLLSICALIWSTKVLLTLVGVI